MGTAYDRVIDGANKVHEESQANEPTALEVIMAVRVILLENGHKANKMLNVLREYLNRTEKELMNEREQASIIDDIFRQEEVNQAKKDPEIQEMGTFDLIISNLTDRYQALHLSGRGRNTIEIQLSEIITQADKAIAKAEDIVNHEDEHKPKPGGWIKVHQDPMKKFDQAIEYLRNLYQDQHETGRQMIMLCLDAIKDMASKRIEGHQQECQAGDWTVPEQDPRIQNYSTTESGQDKPGDYRERMITERGQLSVRYGKLNDFICSDEYDKLPSDERSELSEQRHHMACYLKVLGRRVAKLDRL